MDIYVTGLNSTCQSWKSVICQNAEYAEPKDIIWKCVIRKCRPWKFHVIYVRQLIAFMNKKKAGKEIKVVWVLRKDCPALRYLERDIISIRINAVQSFAGMVAGVSHWLTEVYAFMEFPPTFQQKYRVAIGDLCFSDLSKEMETLRLLDINTKTLYKRFARGCVILSGRKRLWQDVLNGFNETNLDLDQWRNCTTRIMFTEGIEMSHIDDVRVWLAIKCDSVDMICSVIAQVISDRSRASTDSNVDQRKQFSSKQF